MNLLGDVVLVSWVSVNHAASPLLTAVAEDGSPFRHRVRRLYLCWRDAPGSEGDRERAALKATLQQLEEALGELCPELIPIPWKTAAPPTDHVEIRRFAEPTLQRVRQENPAATIVLHLSPGTPAMHAVWLVLGSTGVVDGDLQMIQTSDQRGRAAGSPPVLTVDLHLDTWLRRFRASRPRAAGDDDGSLLDPARVESPALVRAFDQLAEWAPLRVPVLLVGERGTGKTTMANALRARSPFQKAQPGGWPVVVCGQFKVNPELARSELFGHKQGAFTGATSDRVGLLEQADGDSLFLDEIADLDRDTQRLLMAAVEGRGHHRLGDPELRQSRFRLICATNRPLVELRGGLLDHDFFDRVAMFVLRVPPLRECREDLPQLWRGVVERAVGSAEVKPDGWERLGEHEEILRMLRAHHLPGNFRDLQRVAFHVLAAVLADRDDEQVVAVAKKALQAPESESPAAERALPLEGGLQAWLDEQERGWLREAMARGGTKTEAAELLGMPRKTFENRLKKLCGDDG